MYETALFSFLSINLILLFRVFSAFYLFVVRVFRTGNSSHIYHKWDTTILKEQAASGILKFVIHDNAGNKTLVEKPVIIDNNPPNVAIIYESGPVLINDEKFINPRNTIYIIAHSGDNYSSVETIYYATTSGSWIEYSGPLTFTNEGLYTFLCYGVDNNGNISPVISDTFIVDATAPLYSVTVGEPLYTKGDDIFIPLENNISIEATDTASVYASGIKKIEFKVDDGLWEDYTLDGIKIYSEGPKDIFIKVTDHVDNSVSDYIGTYIVDIAPPFTTFSVDGNFYYSYERDIIALGSATDITLEATDLGLEEYRSGVYKTYVVLNNIENEYSNPFHIPEGEVFNLHFYSIDNLGNTEQRNPVQIAVDTLLPVIEIYAKKDIYRHDSIIYSKSNNFFGFEAQDDFAGVKNIFYQVDDAEYSIYTTEYSFGEEKDITIRYYAEDYLAWKSGIQTAHISLDDTPPVTNMTTSLPLVEIDGNLYANSRYVFTWISVDEKSGVDKTIINIDGIQLTTGELTYVFMEDGEHTIEYYSIDHLGNIEETTEITIITPIPDITPPVSSIVSSYSSYNDGSMDYYRTDVVFTIQSEDIIGENESYASGVNIIFFALDGSVYNEYANQEIIVNGEGIHEINFYAIDNTGNIEPEQSYFFTLDETPPETSIIVIDSENIVIEGILFVTETEEIEIISLDIYSGVQIIYWRPQPENEWQIYEGPVTLSAGNYTIQYYAVDNLWNTEESKSTEVKIITDYNNVSYKTDVCSIKPEAIQDYDVSHTKIAYLKGSEITSNIFVGAITEGKNNIFSNGNKISRKSQKRTAITINEQYIATSEIQNNSQDIYLYTIEGNRQEGENISYNGINIQPVIIDDIIYWIQLSGNVYSLIKYDIQQKTTDILFTTPFTISTLKKDRKTIVFMVEEDEFQRIYAYKENEIAVIYENILSVSNNEIANFSLYSNLLVIEMIEETENKIYIYTLTGNKNILITQLEGKNPQVEQNYIFYTNIKTDTEILTLFNIINNVKTSIVKGTEIERTILFENKDIFVQRKSETDTIENSNERCDKESLLSEILYLKDIESEALVSGIVFSSGSKNFAYNKFFDKEDFIYSDMDTTLDDFISYENKCIEKSTTFHHIQTFDADKTSTEANLLSFASTKDIQIIIIQEKAAKQGNFQYSRCHAEPCSMDIIRNYFKGFDILLYQVGQGEEFILQATGSVNFAPIVLIIEQPET